MKPSGGRWAACARSNWTASSTAAACTPPSWRPSRRVPRSAGWSRGNRASPGSGSPAWPTRTRLEIEPPRTRIGRNEAFEVRGRVSGVVPERATITYQFDGRAPQEHEYGIARDTDAAGRLSARLDAGRVQRSFRFRVAA